MTTTSPPFTAEKVATALVAAATGAGMPPALLAQLPARPDWPGSSQVMAGAAAALIAAGMPRDRAVSLTMPWLSLQSARCAVHASQLVRETARRAKEAAIASLGVVEEERPQAVGREQRLALRPPVVQAAVPAPVAATPCPAPKRTQPVDRAETAAPAAAPSAAPAVDPDLADLPPIPPIVRGALWTRAYIDNRLRIMALHRRAALASQGEAG